MNSNQNDFQFNEYDMQALFEENLPDETLPADLSERLLNTILLEVEQVYAPSAPLHQRSLGWLVALFQNRWIVPLTTTAAVAAVLAFVVITRLALPQQPRVVALAQGGSLEVLRENGRALRVSNGDELLLFEGDTLVTQSGYAILQWQPDQQIMAGPNARIAFPELGTRDNGTQFQAKVDRGGIFVDINRKLVPGRDLFAIQTPNGVVQAVGTEFLVRVDVTNVNNEASPVQSSTSLTVREGKVVARVVSNSGAADVEGSQDAPVEMYEVAQNWQLTVANNQEPVLKEVSDAQIYQELASVAPQVVAAEVDLPLLKSEKKVIRVLPEPNREDPGTAIVLAEEDWEVVGETPDGQFDVVVNGIGDVGYVPLEDVEPQPTFIAQGPTITVPVAAPTSTPTQIALTAPSVGNGDGNQTPGRDGRVTPGETRVAVTPPQDNGTGGSVTVSPTVSGGVEEQPNKIEPGPSRTATLPSIVQPTPSATSTVTPTSTALPVVVPNTATATLTPLPPEPTSSPTATPTPTDTPPQPKSVVVLPTQRPTPTRTPPPTNVPDSPLPSPTTRPTATVSADGGSGSSSADEYSSGE